MPKLVQKSGYIKSGGGAGYLKYIATREGVEKLHGRGEPTKPQRKLVSDLLRDYPDSRDLFEYEDYCANPTVSTASAFITAAIDYNAHAMKEGHGYMKYIATRPRVEKRGDHGLFSRSPNTSLDAAIAEAEAHTGNKWTLIFSLRREDAARLGYDSAEKWRQLIMRHSGEIAVAMKIPPDKFRWYAAFHDEGHHPHIHMMVWSADPKQGYLTKAGIKTVRSKLTNDVFQGELQQLYQRKDISYKEVSISAQTAMRELISRMNTSLCDRPDIANQMRILADTLETVTGKKVYGYLPKPIKDQVDAIVDNLAQIAEVAECYKIWNELRDELERYYKSKPRIHLPLSQQKEFRAIKNIVIQEAENIRLGVVSFEDEEIKDESEPEFESQEPNPDKPRFAFQTAEEYRKAKAILADSEQPLEIKEKAVSILERLWDEGFTVAAHQLGKVWRDGLCDFSDEEQAEVWFRRSSEAGNDYSQYALGKLLQGQGRVQEAMEWYKKADERGNQFARYRLGKLYLLGADVPKDVDKAICYLSAAAAQGNQFAQYALGKLYLLGRDVEQDREQAKKWLTLSAEQGNQYAQFFLDRFDQYHDPNVLLCATKLLYHMSRVFQSNSVPPTNPVGLRMDSKRRRALLEKRLAMGHKLDDHEEAKMVHTR